MVGSILRRFTILRESPALGLSPGEVLLTFDDGPNLHHRTTERLLDVLHHHQVRTCFCLIGDQILQAPELTERIHQDGHLIVNHTQTHPTILLKSERTIQLEIQQCDETIATVLGTQNHRCTFMRTPGGVVTPAVERVLQKEERELLYITGFSFDTLHGPAASEVVIRRTLADAEKNRGGIFVLHDGRHSRWRASSREMRNPNSGANRSWVPEAVDQMLTEMKTMGLTLVHPQAILDRQA